MIFTKRFFIPSLLAFFILSCVHVKKNTQVKQQSLYHIPASQTLVGIWKQTGIKNPRNGNVVDIPTGNYKVINPDGTFYTFITWNAESTTIGQYGSYEVTSDSLMVEHIIRHMNTQLNGEDCKVRYKFIDEKTVIMGWSFDGKHWTDERWTRLPLPE